MRKEVFVLISALVIGLLWWFQYNITVNVPWWDDFHGIILPVHTLFTEVSLHQKLQHFFSLNNEHRVVNDRIFTWLVYTLRGTFDLKAVALLGFVNLIGIYLVVVKAIRKSSASYFTLLPVLFLLFHAQYYESLQSLMVPFQNFSVLLYLLLSLYFVSFKKQAAWAFFFATAALFSHGNGILVYILGALLLIIQGQGRKSVFWSLGSVLIIALYFWGYSKPSWTETDVISPWDQPLSAVSYAFEFLGAYALNSIDTSARLATSSAKQLLPASTGVLAVGILVFLVFKKYSWKNLFSGLRNAPSDQFFLGMAAFFIGTGIMMGLTRTGFPVLSRYTINSSFLLIAIWGFYSTNFKAKGNTLAILITGTFWLLSYYNATEKAVYNRDNALADAYNYRNTGTWSNQYSDSAHVSRVNPLLSAPLVAGEYRFPADEFLEELGKKAGEPVTEASVEEGHMTVKGESKIVPYFRLESEDYSFIFPGKLLRNSPLQILKGQGYFSTRYATAFPMEVIPRRNYRLVRVR
jgi:hypothetical protein